jgi:hypothetical protein
MGLSNLTIRRKNHTNSQKKLGRKRKALLKEAEGSAGADPARTSGGGSAVITEGSWRYPTVSRPGEETWPSVHQLCSGS